MNSSRTPVRKQLLYQPGELARVGQIWIIESLGADDFKTGKRLWEDLSDLRSAHRIDLKIAYCETGSATEIKQPGKLWRIERRRWLNDSVTPR